MTKQIYTFNIPYASVSSYDTASGLNDLRRMEGVQDVQMYHATEGQPTYMLIVDVQDEREGAVRTQVQTLMRQYAEYVQDVTVRSYRPL